MLSSKTSLTMHNVVESLIYTSSLISPILPILPMKSLTTSLSMLFSILFIVCGSIKLLDINVELVFISFIVFIGIIGLFIILVLLGILLLLSL